MKSTSEKTPRSNPRTVKWTSWPKGDFVVKLGCSDPAWKKHRNDLTRAGIVPATVYFKDGVKVAEQFRLTKAEWGGVWRDKSIPVHTDVATFDGTGPHDGVETYPDTL